MAPVSFVKTTKSYVKTTESYEVSRLGYYMDSTFTGKDQNGIKPDCAGRAQLQKLVCCYFSDG